MARTDTLGNFLTDVATAIRNKKGTTDTIVASNFDTEIESIESGGGDVSEYFGPASSGDTANGGYSGISSSILKIPDDFTFLSTSASYMFTGCKNLKSIPQLDTSGIKYMSYMFSYCSSLETIPLLDTSNVITMGNMFQYCTNLKTIPLLDTSNNTEINYMFRDCSSLTSIPLINISKCKQMQHTFSGCSSLTEIPQLDTSNINSFYNSFGGCTNLITVPKLNASKAIYMINVFNGASNLTNFGGFENLGQAYLTTASENNSNYELYLSSCTNLTHDSLMNVINNLYDIKTKGCKNQKLNLGTTNLAKLTEEEIAIATNKGWNVV